VELKLAFEEPISEQSRRLLTEELVAFQTELYGESHYTTIGYFWTDEEGRMKGGLSGRFRWGWLYIEMIWVAEELRGQGHGLRLLEEAEAFARSRGGIAVQVDAGGDTALPFFQRNGYHIVGSMPGYPPGSSHHSLRKWLVDSPAEAVSVVDAKGTPTE
jgi:ribosomal protein S18 acetylase RimI-like enzyme